jgi:hypothetical protein
MKIRPFLVFSVLRQFKIVKPTRQQGEKTNKQVVSTCCMDVKYNKKFIHFFFSAKEILNKV